MESAEKKVLPPQISEIGICLGPFSPSQARRASDLYGSDPRIYLIDRISKFLQLEIMDADDEAEFYGADMHIDLLWDDFLNDVRDDCNDFGVENSEILWADIDSTGDDPLIDWIIETWRENKNNSALLRCRINLFKPARKLPGFFREKKEPQLLRLYFPD